MIQDLANALRNAPDALALIQSAKDAADYLDSLADLEKSLRNLHDIAANSLANDRLDDETKGHRLGTIEMCLAMLKLF